MTIATATANIDTFRRTIYQHLDLSLKQGMCHRVEVMTLSDGRCITHVLFEQFNKPCGTGVEVMVPWQSAFEFWRKNGGPRVTSVVIGGQAVRPFADWFTNSEGRWFVCGLNHSPIFLSVSVEPYLQHAELDQLQRTPRR